MKNQVKKLSNSSHEEPKKTNLANSDSKKWESEILLDIALIDNLRKSSPKLAIEQNKKETCLFDFLTDSRNAEKDLDELISLIQPVKPRKAEYIALVPGEITKKVERLPEQKKVENG